ncbi:MAG: histidine phosphatase family protein [Alphaproteobacteria bacterium]
MTRLLVVRHGNTFSVGAIVRRVGARTDLPLVEDGIEQARKLGHYLAANKLLPDAVYTSELQRTRQTANYALAAARASAPILPRAVFNEIDYGPDENQSEDYVLTRIGHVGLRAWEEKGIPPQGWLVDPEQLQKMWRAFGDELVRTMAGATVMVVTSNGIARFAPYLTGDYQAFLSQHKPKLATGALGILEHDGTAWTVKDWNIRPATDRWAR